MAKTVVMWFVAISPVKVRGDVTGFVVVLKDTPSLDALKMIDVHPFSELWKGTSGGVTLLMGCHAFVPARGASYWKLSANENDNVKNKMQNAEMSIFNAECCLLTDRRFTNMVESCHVFRFDTSINLIVLTPLNFVGSFGLVLRITFSWT